MAELKKSLGSVKTHIVEGVAIGGPSGITACPLSDSLIVVDRAHSRLCTVPRQGKAKVLVQCQQSAYPSQAITTEDGTVLFTEMNKHRVQKLDVDSNVVSTLAGTGHSGHSQGPALKAKFSFPGGIYHDPGSGAVYVTDSHAVRQIQNDVVTTLAGSGRPGFRDGQGSKAAFNYPRGIAMTLQGELVVADTYNHAVRLVNAKGRVRTLAGNGDAGFANQRGPQARFHCPVDLAVGKDGTVYVADFWNHRIRMIDMESRRVTTLAGNGHFGGPRELHEKGLFNCPNGLSIRGDGFLCLIDDVVNARIQSIDIRAKEWKLSIMNKSNVLTKEIGQRLLLQEMENASQRRKIKQLEKDLHKSQNQNVELERRGRCIICEERDACIVGNLCDHIVFCYQCFLMSLDYKQNCPICRARLEEVRQLIPRT